MGTSTSFHARNLNHLGLNGEITDMGIIYNRLVVIGNFTKYNDFDCVNIALFDYGTEKFIPGYNLLPNVTNKKPVLLKHHSSSPLIYLYVQSTIYGHSVCYINIEIKQIALLSLIDTRIYFAVDKSQFSNIVWVSMETSSHKDYPLGDLNLGNGVLEYNTSTTASDFDVNEWYYDTNDQVINLYPVVQSISKQVNSSIIAVSGIFSGYRGIARKGLVSLLTTVTDKYEINLDSNYAPLSVNKSTLGITQVLETGVLKIKHLTYDVLCIIPKPFENAYYNGVVIKPNPDAHPFSKTDPSIGTALFINSNASVKIWDFYFQVEGYITDVIQVYDSGDILILGVFNRIYGRYAYTYGIYDCYNLVRIDKYGNIQKLYNNLKIEISGIYTFGSSTYISTYANTISRQSRSRIETGVYKVDPDDNNFRFINRTR